MSAEFHIIRPDGETARLPSGRVTANENGPERVRPIQSNRSAVSLLPGWLVRLFVLTAVLTHALGAWVGGSLDPEAWSPMVTMTCIFVIAPCIGLAIAVFEDKI